MIFLVVLQDKCLFVETNTVWGEGHSSAVFEISMAFCRYVTRKPAIEPAFPLSLCDDVHAMRRMKFLGSGPQMIDRS